MQRCVMRMRRCSRDVILCVRCINLRLTQRLDETNMRHIDSEVNRRGWIYHMKEKVSVTGVPETMIQTLYARAKESGKKNVHVFTFLCASYKGEIH